MNHAASSRALLPPPPLSGSRWSMAAPPRSGSGSRNPQTTRASWTYVGSPSDDLASAPSPESPKTTIRCDEGLKADAERWARERGIPVAGVHPPRLRITSAGAQQQTRQPKAKIDREPPLRSRNHAAGQGARAVDRGASCERGPRDARVGRCLQDVDSGKVGASPLLSCAAAQQRLSFMRL